MAFRSFDRARVRVRARIMVRDWPVNNGKGQNNGEGLACKYSTVLAERNRVLCTSKPN